jgi:predicted amidophosphoribosyltransferase
LKNAFNVIDQRYIGKTVLLFDDIYRSGTTLNTAAKVLKERGKVRDIFALTITKTRKKR